MRDVVVVGLLLLTVPYVLRRPWLGVLSWSWVSYMNPHRLCWGFAYSFPAAALTAGSLFLGMLLSGEKFKLPRHPIIILYVALIVWFTVCFLVSFNPDGAYLKWNRIIKTQLVTFVVFGLINERKRIVATVATVAFSIGYFGIKGGVFSLMTGFSFKVWGPSGTHIEGNNEIALATLMIIPLFRFLQLQATKIWQRRALGICIILCFFSVISSYSRGAFLAMGAGLLMLVWRSRNRVPMLLSFVIILPIVFVSLPAEWTDRMSTIRTYDEDASAMSRINTWQFAINMANDRPLVGGGLRSFTRQLYAIYAPDPRHVYDAHSIYFEMLGETGYVGLSLFLALFFAAYASAGRTAKLARGDPSLIWAVDLCAMLQVSLVCYAVGGAFLGLATFDLPYHLVAFIVIASSITRAKLEANKTPEGRKAPS